MSSCTYKFKNASGEEVTITGQAEMKAFLANGGLEQLLPGKVLPWNAKSADGRGRAIAGGQEGVNGYFYKGGQFLPTTMAAPGKWKVDKKWVTSGRALVAPGEYSYQPTPFSRSLFEIAGVGHFTVIGKDGKMAVNLGVRANDGSPVNRYMEIRPGVKGVLGKESLMLGEIVDAWNGGQRWFDVKPDAETITTQDDAPAESPKVEAKPALSYIHPSKVDTPAQGALANAIEQKSRAWSQVKTLRSRVKDGETNLRVDLLKAEDMWREAKRYEADAREQIEVEANKQGMTTKRDSGPLYEVDQNGDPSPEEAEAVQRGLQGKNPIEAAAWLAENAPPQYATIAAKVHDKLQDLSSNFGVNFGLSIVYPGAMAESELSVARGATIPVQQDGGVALRIVLNGAGMKGRVGTSYRTALHELAHAATMQSVQLGHKGFPQYAQSVRDLVDVANAINRHMGMRAKTKPAELTDFERSVLSGRSNLFDSIDEVLVWGMTSPDAQAYLESIPYNSKSLWTAFVAAVRKVLGLSESNDTALSEILRISEVLMKPLDVDGSSGFARLNSRYEIQHPHGGRVFRNPGGVDDATWTGEAVDEGAARSSALVASIRAKSEGPAVLRNDYPDTQAFREWFGNSKMTNKAGEPLLFMHGSPASFEAFDSSKLGTSSSHTSSGLGHFFTRDRATAERYADGGNIYEGWLRIENPYVMPREEAQAFDDVQDSAARRKELQKQGYDGVVILDDQGKQWATVAFEPWQFKSTDNNGNFDEFEDGFRLRDPRIAFRDTSTMRDSPAVPREQAEDFIRRFVAEYPAAPKIVLAESFYQLPEDIQSDALEQGSGPTRAKGALKNGKAYVVLNTHTSMADLEASVFHEVLGHAGIRKLLGPAFAQELNKMFIGLGGYSKMYQIMSRRGMGRQFEGYYDAVQRAREKNPEVWTEFLASSILTEEVFAHIAEQKNAKALRDRFMALVGMVRDWLRRNGFARLASLGESDIVFLLQRARAGLKNGSGVIRDGVTVGETVIVDAEGRPVAKKGSPDYEMLKAVSERMGLRETNGPTVFSNSLPEEGKPGDDARMDDANNVAGKQAPTPAGDVEAGGAKPRYTARDWREWSELPEFQNDDESTVLFNHGRDGYINQVENGKFDTFDGIFALRAPGMVERGPDVTAFRIPDDKMLSQRDLNYNLDPDEVTSALLDVFPRKIEQGEESFDEAWKAIVEDRSDFESLGLEDDGSVRENSFMDTLGYSADDAGEASWFAQKLRGRLAQKLGYQAVEMDDENGTSWYIVPGVKSIPLPNESPASASSDAPTVFRTVTPEQLNAYAQPRGTVAREAFNNVVSAFKQPSAKVFGTLHKTIATQLHKAWVSKDYAKVFGLADAYERDISRFSADPATVAPNLLPSFDSLAAAAGRMIHGNKNAKIMDGVAEAIIAGTLAGEDVTSGRVWTDAELRNQFGLSEQQVGLYKESRAAIDASLDAASSGIAWQMVKNYIPTLKESVRAETGNAETIIDGAMRELEEELREIARFQQTAEREGAIPEGAAAKTIKKAKDVAEARAAAEGIFLRADALKTAGYAPLMRFGKYAVDVVETLPDGTQERLGFYKFETEIEAKFAADALKKKHPKADVSRSVMSEEAWKLYRGVDPELVSLFADKIDGLEGLDVQNEVLQEWYRSAVNDRSAFKRMIQRKGVEGFERDLTRVVANFITSNARVAARQFNMGDISKEIADMQARKVSGDVVDEAVKLKDYMENPTEPFQGLKGWMFAWFLGGSVASAALNMTQPLMMTLPYLSQFGGRKAAASLAGATKEAMSGNVSDPELKRALARAAKDGKVDPQQVHHLYHEGMSSFLSKLPLGAGARERAQGFMTLWGYMFGAVENFNRRITFIAAYRMAKNDPSLGNPYDFAVKAIDETQGIYNKANRPNWARGTGPFGAIGVAAFTFKQYSIGYIELLVRMAKSGRNGKLGAAAMLGLLVMLSGLQGFPGADDMEDIIDTVSQHLGYTGNSKLAIRNKLREVLGEEAGNVAMNGVLSLLLFDIGSRVGLGNLLPASAIAKPSEQNRGAQLAELFGPPLSMANQVIDASLAVESGGGAMSVAKVMAPVAFKNLMAAYDMADSGVYRDTRDRKVTDVSLADAMFKAGGFQPMSVSKEQKGARLVEMTGQRIRMVKAAINGMKARAIVENDNDLRQRAEAMRLDWNSKNPEAVIMPDAPSVMRRVKEMNTERRARLMKSLPKEYRRVAEGEMN